MPSAYPSHLLFVLGMHRSGTSALSRIFNLLGFSAPKTLMKANASNQKGHWESTPIARLNDEILAAMQLDWSDWSVGNTAGLRAKARANFYDDILSTLAQEFPEGRPAVVKDPRICRLMDFYRQALEEETVAASAIIPVRNPLAVMRSLEARNGMSETDA
ncbi:MAG: sulfotransferase family protein, partial [Pseudomonadota bacterium]|nr:sulfotransferase family protein [Pseudomonadota bacterium]